MKKLALLMLFVCMYSLVFAADQYTFFNMHNPATAAFVYDGGNTTATGNEVAVNTYKQKTIMIYPSTTSSLKEYVEVRIEGRIKENPNYCVLNTTAFGVGSALTSTNVAVDVTQYVDFLRVGMRKSGTDGNSQIDVQGIFTTLER